MTDEPPNWPTPGMTLFGEVTQRPDWQANAFIGDPNWDTYRFGYQRAVELLLAETISGRDQDFLIYPILYLARHAVELGLKHMISLLQQILNDAPAPRPVHGLGRLWSQAKPLLRSAGIMLHHPGILESDGVLGFAQLVAELDEIDKASTTFRYPTTVDGDQSFVNSATNQLPGTKIPIVPDWVHTGDLDQSLDAMFKFIDGTTEWIRNSDYPDFETP